MTKHEWKAMIAKNYWTTTAVATAATTTTLKTQQRRREITQNYYGSFKTNEIVDNVGIFKKKIKIEDEGVENEKKSR